ncbi:IspD/TarI family cytidylyltransferase [Devriesea agamarum]|uniref:IspD/TarI family cytidylyltransferase n=1 Tax=Devriesea agamarum TaxID=472569 RepID=UPI00071DAC62|nr:IspD/TarI family cytidylyltransferase [Devriesea agamarum]
MNSRRRPPWHRGRRSPQGPTAAGIVLAGGTGSRVGAALNKAFLPLSGRTIASWGLSTMASIRAIDPLVFVVRPEDRAHAEFVAEREVLGRDVEIIHGGKTRQESELLALRHLADRIDAGDVTHVLIHDAARPLVSRGLVGAVLHAAMEHGGAVPALPAPELLAHLGHDGLGLLQHEGLVRVQTPQGFDAPTILDAYEAAARDGFVGTDTASCAEEYTDLDVVWVRGEETNFKITYAQDLLLAQDVVTSLKLRVRD